MDPGSHPCWISNQHQKHKSGRGPSNEHFWQVWLNSVQWFQRRRFKCEKLTDRQMLSHDKKMEKYVHRTQMPSLLAKENRGITPED
jgi:hypothetical protein